MSETLERNLEKLGSIYKSFEIVIYLHLLKVIPALNFYLMNFP